MAEHVEAPANTDRFIFHFGPFRFTSDFDIPHLHRIPGSGTVAVSVQQCEVPEQLPHAATFDRFCQVAVDRYLLNIPGVARFLVEGGERVGVQVAPGAAMADVCSYLLGSVFGALCHQNGLLPLHASAIDHQGGVTAFLGNSGAGKSTMAACLQARGYRVVSDDICLLEEAPEAMHVIPIAGWLKLWRGSLDHLGAQPDESERVFVAEDKYRMYLESPTTAPLTLRNIVVLARAENAEEAPRLESMSAAETLAAMMQMTYLAYVAQLTGAQARVFASCARALRQAQGFRLIVPWGWNNVDAVLDLLEQRIFS